MLPESASSYGGAIDHLFWVIVGITGFFFLLVQGGLLFFVLKYRARPGAKASYVHGNTLLEIVWTIVPTLILLWLTIASQQLWVSIHSPRIPMDSMFQVEILAEQFAWNIRYPGPDKQFDTPDDVTTINQLHLPVGTPSSVRIKSKDVIHSFFVPQFRVKQDTVPGLPTRVWIEPTRVGQFEILCAELCGLGHYRMRGFVTTESEEDLQKWLVETKANE